MSDPGGDPAARREQGAPGERDRREERDQSDGAGRVRRRVLIGSALALALGGGGVALTRLRQGAGPLHPFGFTVATARPGAMDLFEADLDTVAGLGMGSVRIGAVAEHIVADWGVEGGRYTGAVGLSEEGMSALDRGLDLARDRDLAIYLMSVDAYAGEAIPDEDFDRLMHDYWTALAERFADRVSLWQIFNEADGSHYRTYEKVDAAVDAAYAADLARQVAAARDAIRAVRGDARVTMNLGGYPVDAALFARWETVLDTLAPSLDVVTVDAYPDLSDAALSALVTELGDLRERHGKPVAIGEIGLPTCPTCYTAQQQSEAYERYVAALGDAGLEGVYFYMLRDAEGTDPESSFGVADADGRAKPSLTRLEEIAG